MKTDFNKVPKDCFEKKTRKSDGKLYYEIGYDLKIEINQSGLMKFSLEVDGQEYSAVEASF